MYSYLERKQTLEKPAEREKLLSEIPKVIAGALEIELTETAPENVEESFHVNTVDINCNNGHGLQPTEHVQEVVHPAVVIGEGTNTETLVLPMETRIEFSQMPATEVLPTPVIAQVPAAKVAPVVPVIELSDDDEEVEDPKTQNPTLLIHPDALIWHYLDPHGHIQGPFSLTSLKRWYDNNFFDKGFRVWKTDQTPSDALLLTDVLRLAFLCK